MCHRCPSCTCQTVLALPDRGAALDMSLRALGVLLRAGAAVAVRAEEKPPGPRHTISVTGQGEVKAVPDQIVASFAVETTGTRATDAAAENAKRSTAVAAALKALLAPEDTVGTTHYAVDPRYEPGRPGEAREPRIVGYVARNEVQIESRRIDKAGALVDAAIGAGANRVGSLQFSLSKRDELLRSALEKAGADARSRAYVRGMITTLAPALGEARAIALAIGPPLAPAS